MLSDGIVILEDEGAFAGDAFDEDASRAGDSTSASPAPSRCEAPDAIDRVVDVANLVSSFAAQQAVAIHEMHEQAVADAARDGLVDRDVIERSIRLELACALRVTEATAGALLRRAEALTQRYPAVFEALQRARITERHADVLVELVDRAEEELRADLVPVALELAERLPVGTFRRALRALVDRARALTLPDRHREALAQRRVSVQVDDDGMAWLNAYLPAVEARAILNRLTEMALRVIDGEKALERERTASLASLDLPIDGSPGSLGPRTLDQVRADVLGDLLVDGEASALPEAARGVRATVAVTVPALSLLDDATAAGAPAEMEGIGPIPIETARRLAGTADGWMRVLTHPETGVVLSVGRERYRPPRSLQRLVRWRSGRCMAPGCHMPADRCQLDHSIAWQHGGRTAADNISPLCQGHHTVKHHGGWKLRQRAGGTIEWTSPSGRLYTVEPERRRPTFVADSVPAVAPF
ncbi:DUF222 domain-containing protein [Microbacterium sp. NPDC089189]|uniref:HNH endonuclease signature motif containing protein n=1 Tax=Microbacterium sp. NPDC089189 TaxID=3154972 RepID=UPI003444928E